MARSAQNQTIKPIMLAQIKRIHTIIHVLQIDDDTYRAALSERFNVASCKDLSINQAQAFIKELENISIAVERDNHYPAEKQPERFSELDNRPGMASPQQLRKIEAMWQDVSVVSEQNARGRALRQFVQRVAGVADMRFLDSEGAGKIINALNAMKRRGKNSAKEPKPKKAI